MKTIITVCLFITALGAFNSVIEGMNGTDFIDQLISKHRTVGTDFIRIIIALATVITLFSGLKKIHSKQSA